MNNGRTRRKSELAPIERISPNKTIPRGKVIRRQTPHGVGGNLSVESTLGLASFHDGKTASVSYAIGSDGRRGFGVEETNRPWTSSSTINDNQAITFEIAQDGTGPDWHMSDLAINAYLDLAVDIANFYGFKKINYKEKPSNISGATAVETWISTWAKDDEMLITLHNWYAKTECPGPYFMRQLPWLVREMNKRLQDPTWIPEAFVGEGATYPRLKKGAKGDSVYLLQTKLNAHGASPILKVDGEFGSLTETAVKAFQTAKKLAVDGVVFTNTWNALMKDKDIEKPPVTNVVNEPTTSDKKEYLIQITASILNIRKEPGTDKDIVRPLINDKNIYTIVEEANGVGASKWGRLKSDEGWISLDHVIKL